jgi:NADH dehydrogenase FAD-containing subunit
VNSMMWRRPNDDQSVDAANSQKLESETANSTAVPSAVRPSRVASLLHHIVIVGGGAAGLELATKLGDRLGRRERPRSH